jgi:hypothetical protein
MSKEQKNREKNAWHEGERDGRRGQVKERGFVERIGDDLLGKSAERRAYERGAEHGRKRG